MDSNDENVEGHAKRAKALDALLAENKVQRFLGRDPRNITNGERKSKYWAFVKMCKAVRGVQEEKNEKKRKFNPPREDLGNYTVLVTWFKFNVRLFTKRNQKGMGMDFWVWWIMTKQGMIQFFNENETEIGKGRRSFDHEHCFKFKQKLNIEVINKFWSELKKEMDEVGWDELIKSNFNGPPEPHARKPGGKRPRKEISKSDNGTEEDSMKPTKKTQHPTPRPATTTGGDQNPNKKLTGKEMYEQLAVVSSTDLHQTQEEKNRKSAMNQLYDVVVFCTENDNWGRLIHIIDDIKTNI